MIISFLITDNYSLDVCQASCYVHKISFYLNHLMRETDIIPLLQMRKLWLGENSVYTELVEPGFEASLCLSMAH